MALYQADIMATARLAAYMDNHSEQVINLVWVDGIIRLGQKRKGEK